MRKLSILFIAFTLLMSNVIAQTKTTPSAGTKPAATAPAKTGTSAPAKPGSTSKTSTTKTAPAAAAAPAGKVTGEDKVNGIDIFKNDKDQKDYNYNDRIKISKPLMPSYEYMQPFFEKGKKRKTQQEAYLANKYYYPSRPKNKWEVGVGVGMQYMFGDVDSRGLSEILNNSGFHVEVRKSISYFLSWRAMYQYGTSTNRKWLPDNTAALYTSVSGTPNYNGGLSFLGAPNNGLFFPSVQLYNHSLSADIIFTIGNTRFHKERTKFTLDLFLGVSAFLQRTKADYRDANGNPYNYSKAFDEINKVGAQLPNDGAYTALKSGINRVLDSLLDGTYESYPDQDRNLPMIMGYTITPAPTFGVGLNYRISKLINIGLISRFTMPGTDLLDGIRFAGGTKIVNSGTGAVTVDLASVTSQSNDILNYSAINFAFNLGGKRALEPLYWQNPIHHANFRMAQMDPEKLINEAFKDDDGDGVPNQLDKEANTKKGYPVDVQGRALDSDKDGLKDGEDKEPYSLPNYPIDEYGVAIVPPPACCAQMDSMGRMMGGDGSGGGGGMMGGSACNEITLPGLMYDKDQYGAERRDFIPILHIVGEKLQMCPDAKIVVSGINDKNSPNGKYNEQLSYNRANDAINYLTEKYGISRDRFIMKYNQEGSGDKNKDRKVDFRFAKEGETGDGNPPAPHPGLKAGRK